MRPNPSPTPFLDLAALLLVLAVAAVSPATGSPEADTAGGGDGPWSLLTSVRDSLVEAGPTRADFVQTYVPAGFSSGEEETGTLSLELPDCLRWDYSEPYPKSFLLCGDTAWYWNPEDGEGRRYPVERAEEPGLDLVLLGVDQLEERYRIERQDGAAGASAGDAADAVTLELTPSEDSARLRSATLVVDPEARRILRLSYLDPEGNLTRFDLEDYRPLRDASAFEVPAGIEWVDDEAP